MARKTHDIDEELFEALKIACPRGMWFRCKGRFGLDTGAEEKFYTRAEVVAKLIRERRNLEARVESIRNVLDLLDV